MQLPEPQRAPSTQAAAAPQRQVPVALSQESAVADEQAAQATPPTPQDLGEAGMQVFPAQQPLGQEAPSHTQVPATQLVPAAQAGLVPHWHPPGMAHMSARAGSQVTQAAPPPPQAISPPMLHVGPEQQPCGQVSGLQALQTPPMQGPPQS
jgi:hypothetical protein